MTYPAHEQNRYDKAQYDVNKATNRPASECSLARTKAWEATKYYCKIAGLNFKIYAEYINARYEESSDEDLQDKVSAKSVIIKKLQNYRPEHDSRPQIQRIYKIPKNITRHRKKGTEDVQQ